MTRRNGKPQQIPGQLKASSPDAIAFGLALEDRFLVLCDRYLRRRGMQLPLPKSLDADVLRWRQMRVRHRAGDLRNTEAEWESLKTLAQWMVSMNCSLQGQPDKKIQYGG